MIIDYEQLHTRLFLGITPERKADAPEAFTPEMPFNPSGAGFTPRRYDVTPLTAFRVAGPIATIWESAVTKVDMSPHRLDELRAEQIAGFYRNSTPGTIGGMIAAPIQTGMLLYEGAIGFRVAVVFILTLAMSTAARLILVRVYLWLKPPAKDWRRWAFWAIATALVGGSCWGLGALFMVNTAPPEYQFLILLTCAGLAAGSITAFGTYLPSYYCNLFTIMVPSCIWSALRGDPLHWTYAALCVLWMAVVAVLANSFSKLLIDSLVLQFANLDLARDLLRQKERAEAANVAKSNFLASASHDLRQPVHALGMFVGALHERALDEPSSRLVRQIQNSVAALDSLFGAILDISRLDAGVIEARPRAFAVQPLLERICRDEMPEVDRKGISLRLVPCSLTVQTDPVLIERVLRNLISNAVRYTDIGRVVIGCRRGARLSIEVWDSGAVFPFISRIRFSRSSFRSAIRNATGPAALDSDSPLCSA
ncbi:sensor histidine kinase [Bradyrhizobium sp.]|uniref:sensor histidine kinase n=1 Tax=Bradyrhizobium sp. TaxID=376 RepID=UPI0039E30F28